MILKVFIQPNCPLCEKALKLVKALGNKIKVEIYDISSSDGLTKALFFDISRTPSLILLNGIKKKWEGLVPRIEELNSLLERK